MNEKFVSDLKAKAFNFEMEHKLVPRIVAGITAASMMVVPVSAEEVGSTIDYESIKTSLTTGLTTAVTNTVSVASAIIPIAVGAWGLTIMIGYAKKFFTKITG